MANSNFFWSAPDGGLAFRMQQANVIIFVVIMLCCFLLTVKQLNASIAN